MPPPRLERGSLPPEGNALSTELWGLHRNFTIIYADNKREIWESSARYPSICSR